MNTMAGQMSVNASASPSNTHMFHRVFIHLCLAFLAFTAVCDLRAQQDAPEAVVARVMQNQLPGFVFNKRLSTGNENETVLMFQRDQDIVLVGWTNGPERSVVIPANNMVFSLYDENGQITAETQAVNNMVYFPLVQRPQFLIPNEINTRLLIGAAASRVPPVIEVRGPKTIPLEVTFTNVLNSDFLLELDTGEKYKVLRPGEQYKVSDVIEVGRPSESLFVEIGANGFMQETEIRVSNPISISILPDVSGALNLQFSNPSGQPFKAKAELRPIIQPPLDPLTFNVSMKNGQKELSYQVPLASNAEIPYPLQLVLIGTREDEEEKRVQYVLSNSPITELRSAGNFLGRGPDGESTDFQAMATKDATLAIGLNAPPEGLPDVSNGSLELIYNFTKKGGAVNVGLPRQSQRRISGVPSALGMWIYGDESGLKPSISITDATGKRYIFVGKPINWKSWNYVIFPLSQPMTPPLLLDSFIQFDNGDYPSFGKIYLNDPTWIYEEMDLAPLVMEAI